MRKLIILADHLDQVQQFKSADRVDSIIQKFAFFFGRSKKDQIAAELLSDMIVDAVTNVSPNSPQLQSFIEQAGGYDNLIDSLERVSEEILDKLQ